MFKKYYVCECFDEQENKVTGNSITSVWFWQSPFDALIKIRADIQSSTGNDDLMVINFRRVK